MKPLKINMKGTFFPGLSGFLLITTALNSVFSRREQQPIVEVLVHSSYLSQPPQPAVVYFFSAGVLFRIMNAKFWPILSHCDQVRLYFRECKHFLVYFFQAHIMWWCIKIDKYGVWEDTYDNIDLDEYDIGSMAENDLL